MTNMKPPQEGRNTGAPSLRGLQGRSATGLNGQATKELAVGTMARGLDAGKYFWRSGREKCFSLDIPFYRTSPFIGLLARHNFRLARHTTRIALSSGHALHLHLPWSSPNTTTLLSRGNSYMRTSIGPSLALLQRYRSMR